MNSYRRKGEVYHVNAYARPSVAGQGGDGPKYHAEMVANKAGRGRMGTIRPRLIAALDELKRKRRPITYLALMALTGIAKPGTIRSQLTNIRREGWRWGNLIAAKNGAGTHEGGVTDEAEVAARVVMVRSESLAATRDAGIDVPGRPRTLSLLDCHTPAPVPLTELEEARRVTDAMRREGRRMGLLGGKGKARRRRSA